MSGALGRVGRLLRREAGPEEMVAAVLLVFVPLNFLYGAVLTRLDPPEKNDFTSYYVAAHVVRQGMPEALYYPDPVGSLLAQASVQRPWIDVAVAAGVPNPNYYLYPPLFAVACLPLAYLPYEAAFAVWLGANVLFLALSLLLVLRGRGRLPALGIAACVLLAGSSHPVWHHLKIGQSSLLVLLLLAACLALLRAGREVAAGAVLSGAILLKLTPALLVVLLLLRRRWRAAGAAAAGVVVLSTLSAAAVGWGPQAVYVARMVPQLGAGTAFHPNQSLNGFVTRLLGAGDYRKADLSADLPGPRRAAEAAGAAVILISLVAAARRRDEADDAALEDGFASLVLASLLASPISWEHHYVLSLLPAWILAARWRGGAAVRWMPALAGVSLALVHSYVPIGVFEKLGPGPLRGVTSSLALLGGAILWGIFTARGAGGRGREPASASQAPSTALLVLASVFAGAQFLLKVAEYNTSFHYGDFTSYYVAAAAVSEGKGEALYVPRTPDRILAKAETPSEWLAVAASRGVRDANYYLYPPFFALLISPLGLLPYGAAHDLWYVLNLAALGGFLIWYLRAAGPTTPPERAAAVLLAALSWPALFTFGAGQANYVVLLLVFGALVAAERGRDPWAGLLLAAATAIKLTPGLLVLYYLWKRRARIAAWAAGGFAGLTLAAVLAVGWEPHLVYAKEMLPLLSRGCAHWVNQSAAAFFSRLGGADMFAWDVAPGSLLVRAGSLAVAAAFLAALLRLIGPARRDGTERLEFSLVLVTTLFLSPISWIHHAVLSLPALYFLIRHLAGAGRLAVGRCLLVALAFVMTGIYIRPFGFLAAAPLTPLASYHLAGQVLLWALIAAEIRVRREPSAAGAAP